MKHVLIAAAAALAFPVTASAWCGPVQLGSAVQSCEDGVRVIRQTPLALPRISPRDSARMELKRERLQLDRQRAANDYALQSRRLDLKAKEARQREYLYRDANSPLRGYYGGGLGGYGLGGFAGDFGFGGAGFGAGFGPGLVAGGPVRGPLVRGGIRSGGQGFARPAGRQNFGGRQGFGGASASFQTGQIGSAKH